MMKEDKAKLNWIAWLVIAAWFIAVCAVAVVTVGWWAVLGILAFIAAFLSLVWAISHLGESDAGSLRMWTPVPPPQPQKPKWRAE